MKTVSEGETIRVVGEKHPTSTVVVDKITEPASGEIKAAMSRVDPAVHGGEGAGVSEARVESIAALLLGSVNAPEQEIYRVAREIAALTATQSAPAPGGWREANSGEIYTAEQLARLLEARDKFIVAEGLWSKFTATGFDTALSASPAPEPVADAVVEGIAQRLKSLAEELDPNIPATHDPGYIDDLHDAAAYLTAIGTNPRLAFRAGWWTNAAIDQPADYLSQCEDVDWQEYRKSPGIDAYVSALIRAYHDEADEAPAQPAPAAQPDDLAVDRFAAAMKAKLAKKREEGRGGWEGPTCNAGILSRLLRDHVEKGDPLDVGNLAMMLHQRGERIL